MQDQQNARVPDARVSLRNEATGVTASIGSDADGQFTFLDLPSGSYPVTTEAKGFSTSTQEHIAVQVGRTVALTVQHGETQQTVAVTAEAATVDAQTSDPVEKLIVRRVVCSCAAYFRIARNSDGKYFGLP